MLFKRRGSVFSFDIFHVQIFIQQNIVQVLFSSNDVSAVNLIILSVFERSSVCLYHWWGRRKLPSHWLQLEPPVFSPSREDRTAGSPSEAENHRGIVFIRERTWCLEECYMCVQGVLPSLRWLWTGRGVWEEAPPSL